MMPTAFRARWVFPVAGPPIADGIVTIADNRIVSVGRNSDVMFTDLGDVALLPGPVNAHTHLEFSDCPAPLGRPGMPLPEWIVQVVRHRRAVAALSSGQASAIGLLESVHRGTAALGEIATAGWDPTIFERPSPRVVAFYELIGLAEERIEPNLQLAREHLARGGAFIAGLSPHATYTVHPRLLEGLVELAAAADAPVAMHLAESREELELLATHSGPFVEMLESLNAWHPQSIPIGSRPLDYLDRLARAPRALVVHGNYLDDAEIAFLAERAERMTVVYCPRTHAFFGHALHPLPKLLAAGARVALGTDSRASTPSLDVLAEMRAVAAAFPEIDRATILRLGTIDGARALGLESQCGTLEPGRRANLLEVSIADRKVSDPHELLFEDTPSAALWTPV